LTVGVYVISGILPKEKPQEIKTVRIVKRESERRQRDRDRCGSVGIPIPSGTKRPCSLDECVAESEVQVDSAE